MGRHFFLVRHRINVGRKCLTGTHHGDDIYLRERNESPGLMKGQSMKAQSIRARMDVISSCGRRIGTVDHIEGGLIKLTNSDPTAAHEHHFIPLSWVESVDDRVQLNKDAKEATDGWKE